MITVKFRDTFRERLPEWITSVSLFFWGLIVLEAPPILFSQQYYSVLADAWSQESWGYTATVVGVLRLLALGINGAWRPTAHIRALGAGVSMLIWGGIVLSFLTLDWSPPALATASAMLIFELSALWFAAGDAKMADIKAREKHSNGIALVSSV